MFKKIVSVLLTLILMCSLCTVAAISSGAAETVTEAPTEAPVPTDTPTEEPVPIGSDYFLVGSFTEWKVLPEYNLSHNENEDGAEEYVVTAALSAGDTFKVCSGDQSAWYPDGMGNDCVAEFAGEYTIYFRPNGDGHDDWIKDQSGKPVLYVSANNPPVPDKLGDVDDDGVVSILDATKIQKDIAQILTEDDLNLSAADVDGDGVVSIMDAKFIARICSHNGSTPDVPVIETYVYSNFEDGKEAGWWNSFGHCSASNDIHHSKLLKINPGEDMYTGFTIPLSEQQTSTAGSCYDTMGVFLDRNGNFISPVLYSDLTNSAVSYQTSDAAHNPETNIWNYVPIYRFTAPADAHYFSVNILSQSSTSAYAYRQYISNIPIYMYGPDSQNLVIPENSNDKKDKKLCIIGPSVVMINRLSRNINKKYTDKKSSLYDPGISQKYEYICGFQEYLMPFYDEVVSYGYSGAANKYVEGTKWTGIHSIYDAVVNGFTHPDTHESYPPVDLSGFDEILIVGNGNGLTYDSIGTYDSNDVSTYMGALNGIISYIKNGDPAHNIPANPTAKIWLDTNMHYRPYFSESDDSNRIKTDAVNEEIKKLCEAESYEFIDSATELDFNNETIEEYTYDFIHKNHVGNREYGLFLRKKMIGI